MILVDTSSWIEFLRGRNTEPSQRVKALLSRGDAALCDLTMVELWNGAQGRAEKKALEDLEAALPLYPVNERVWASARALARRCRDSGVTVPTADIVIAACATSNNLALEYCDSHFDRILPLAQ